MTQQATTTIQKAANGGQVATQRKPVDILKSMMNAERVQEQFKNALGKNSATFVASVIDPVSYTHLFCLGKILIGVYLSSKSVLSLIIR